MKFKTKTYNSNMEIYTEDGFLCGITHDECIEYDYADNLAGLFNDVAEELGRALTDEEMAELEDVTMGWLDAHSFDPKLEKRDERIYLRCTRREKEALEEMAELKHLSLSAYIISKLFE